MIWFWPKKYDNPGRLIDRGSLKVEVNLRLNKALSKHAKVYTSDSRAFAPIVPVAKRILEYVAKHIKKDYSSYARDGAIDCDNVDFSAVHYLDEGWRKDPNFNGHQLARYMVFGSLPKPHAMLGMIVVNGEGMPRFKLAEPKTGKMRDPDGKDHRVHLVVG